MVYHINTDHKLISDGAETFPPVAVDSQNDIMKGLIRMPMSIQDKEAEAISDRSKTITFTVRDEKEEEMKRTLSAIYEALREKGYNPINQIVGYILSEDPTYITNYKNARSLIRRIDRDELLNALVRNYLGV